MVRFERTNDGVKVRCLTAWLHPYINERLYSFNLVPVGNARENYCQSNKQEFRIVATKATIGASGGIRTPARLSPPIGFQDRTLHPLEYTCIL